VAKTGGAVGFNIGTGPSPGLNDPLTGQAIISQKIIEVDYPSQRLTVSFTDYWGSLTPGMQYWFDANWNTAVGGTFTLFNITVCIADY
jgi:hypothetical protein